MEFDIDDMREFLEREAALINRPEFISDDPVQFPRRLPDKKELQKKLKEWIDEGTDL